MGQAQIEDLSVRLQNRGRHGNLTLPVLPRVGGQVIQLVNGPDSDATVAELTHTEQMVLHAGIPVDTFAGNVVSGSAMAEAYRVAAPDLVSGRLSIEEAQKSVKALFFWRNVGSRCILGNNSK